ncbi:MAG: beta-N-acetylhexosaminidase [Victivallaceae bacterium]|nr:beta-N-acetylhexosaminidase [Victivallaceae bacterium]
MDTTKFIWQREGTPDELVPMLETLADEYPIFDHGRGMKLTFKKTPGKDMAVKTTKSRGEIVIEYTTVSAAARGIGNAMSGIYASEKAPFDTLGVMLDVSRNQVMLYDNIESWLRRMALCGQNLLMLYAENTYEIEDEPLFGYMRGGYSEEEIREIDDYASRLGIEVVGCIQALGHMRQTLRWLPYAKYRDTDSVMLADDKGTLDFIDKMISFWDRTLRSRRIHIGMDEAHDLGRGRHLDIHGYEKPLDILQRHLANVKGICKKHGLKPMMWSDMFFRLTNDEHAYWSEKFNPPKGLKTDPDVEQVYWDYYREDGRIYEEMIRRHRQLGAEPVMASGIYTWGKFWYDHGTTSRTVVPCIEACRKTGTRQIIFTMWGDDGAYCEYDSALAGIVYVSDLAFGDKNIDRTAIRFDVICGGDLKAHIAAGNLDTEFECNGRKYWTWAPALFWDDPLNGIGFDALRREDPKFEIKLLDHLDEQKYIVMQSLDRNGAGDMIHALNTINALQKKLELRAALESAYDSGDMVKLREVATELVPATIAAIREFDRSFREQWLRKSSPLGLEVIQSRNATMICRLEETALRINEYLTGMVGRIDEVEERLPSSIRGPLFPCRFFDYWTGGAVFVN